MYDGLNNTLLGGNPIILITLTLIIVLYYFVFSNLGVSSNNSYISSGGETGKSGLGGIEILLWALFIFLLLINGLQYFFQIDIKTAIKNIFTPEPQIDISILQEKPVEETKESEFQLSGGSEQVFHVSNNEYTYDDAQALCKAYGARLASYNEIEESYKSGGEWCSYGWSKDQLALYPTQKETYDRLKKIPGHERDCGRPGVNGGFIANPNVRFGVNCYGYKPKITSKEITLMEKATPYPITEKDKLLQKQINYYKKQLPDILISPFNNNNWSQV